MRNKIILIVIILAVILGAAAFWYYQKNTYSKEVLKLEILGADQADLLEEIEYTVKYKNNGNVRLEEPILTFEFPDYSVPSGGGSLRKEMVLQDIYPGQEETFHFRVRLVGSAGELKKAKAWLSYKPKNLNARYESETSFTTKIGTVPLTLDLDLPSRIESGKELSFNLNYFSNVDYPISNLAIRMEYPSDFEFQSASPSPLDSSEWEVGLLNKAEGGRIEVTGTIMGQIEEEKMFKAQLGSWQDGNFVLLKESIRAVRIVTPSLYISQQINGSPQYIANPGDTLHYEVIFKNIGSEAFNNLFLVARLEGAAFDFDTLRAPLGEFESGDNSIVFDWRRVSDLQFLDAQEEGKVEFWIDLKEDFGAQNKNPVIKNNVYLSQARQEFANKVNTLVEIGQRGYFVDEIFGNSGPLPPEVGQTTTYTITWQAKNYYSDVDNMQVSATLGRNVSLTGRIFPEGTNLTYDSVSREVVWKLDNLDAGKGVTGAGPNVSFQVRFSPDSSQIGTVPNIIGPAEITGEDQFTGFTVEGTDEAINAALPDDDSVSDGTVR
ncbi:MAG: hypothetical protein PHF07_01285 [Candidatus Pacebacteria bacterium]|jgi:hypothetical protein|nr:hypothetical protein [Candidatus Paceibacterota bacterium]